MSSYRMRKSLITRCGSRADLVDSSTDYRLVASTEADADESILESL